MKIRWIGIVLGISLLMGAGMIHAQGENTDGYAIMTVASETVNCVGVAPQDCLQVRFAGDADWQLLYSDIIGFEYIAGFEYSLLVQKVDVANPPADAPSFRYHLVSILAKVPQLIGGDAVAPVLYAPSGEYFVMTVGEDMPTCRDGFTPDIPCLLISVDGGEPFPINPSRLVNFAPIAGTAARLVVERADLAVENITDVPAFVYQLVQIVETIEPAS